MPERCSELNSDVRWLPTWPFGGRATWRATGTCVQPVMTALWLVHVGTIHVIGLQPSTFGRCQVARNSCKSNSCKSNSCQSNSCQSNSFWRRIKQSSLTNSQDDRRLVHQFDSPLAYEYHIRGADGTTPRSTSLPQPSLPQPCSPPLSFSSVSSRNLFFRLAQHSTSAGAPPKPLLLVASGMSWPLRRPIAISLGDPLSVPTR